MRNFARRIVRSLYNRLFATPEQLSLPQPMPLDQWPLFARDAYESLMAQSRPAVGLVPDYDREVPNEAVSSIAGRPRLPEGFDWPEDEDGKPLLFLMQVNYTQHPSLENHPKSGLLVAFMEEYYESARLFYFEDPSILVRRDLPDHIYPDNPFSVNLHRQGAPLDGHLFESQIDWGAAEVDQIVESWWPAEDEDMLPDDEAAIISKMDNELRARLEIDPPYDFYIGGHPVFRQGDPRKFDRGKLLESEVVLQMGSDIRAVNFGDSGTAVFFATPQDLRSMNVSDIGFDCSSL